MSYDLAVWEGQRPADDEAATKFYTEQIIPQLEGRDPRDPAPPTPRIRAYARPCSSAGRTSKPTMTAARGQPAR
jgi:hypothetical protein